jgi:hypothetical protein
MARSSLSYFADEVLELIDRKKTLSLMTIQGIVSFRIMSVEPRTSDSVSCCVCASDQSVLRWPRQFLTTARALHDVDIAEEENEESGKETLEYADKRHLAAPSADIRDRTARITSPSIVFPRLIVCRSLTAKIPGRKNLSHPDETLLFIDKHSKRSI